MADLAPRIRAELEGCGVDPALPIVVACSGGPDSTALTALLAEAGCRRPILACFDHGLRPAEETAADAAVVRSLASRLDAELEEGRAPRGAIAAEAGRLGASIEERARRARYGFLAEVCRRRGAPVLVTGHTRDDQVETVLMRLLQGSDVEGLSGMRRCSPLPGAPGIRLVRPGLGVTRRDLEEYLASRDLHAAHDPSNEDRRFLRNRVRHEVLPFLESVFPGVRDGVYGSAQRLGEVADLVADAADRAAAWQEEPGSERRPPGGGLRMDRAAFFALPPPLRRRALFAAIDRIGSSHHRIPYRFLDSVPALDPGRRRGVVARGHGVRIELDGGWIACRRDIVPGGDRGYLYSVANELPRAMENRGCMEIELQGHGDCRERVCLEMEELEPPLVARSRRPGDAIALPAGHRVLKRVFQDCGVPTWARDRVPVLEDRRGVVAVCGKLVGAESAWRRGVRREDDGAASMQTRVAVDFREVIEPYAGQQSG